MKGFKEFILRGNVIDLAVAVVIGAAFTAIVTAIVTSVFNPLIGALFDASTLAEALPVTIPTASGGEATIFFGAVIAAVINFLIVIDMFVVVVRVGATVASIVIVIINIVPAILRHIIITVRGKYCNRGGVSAFVPSSPSPFVSLDH